MFTNNVNNKLFTPTRGVGTQTRDRTLEGRGTTEGVLTRNVHAFLDDRLALWCGTSSHRYFVTVANLGSKKKKTCGVVCWQRRHDKYLHTAYFFRCISTKDKSIWFLWLKKGRKDVAVRAQAGRAFKREALRRRQWQISWSHGNIGEDFRWIRIWMRNYLLWSLVIPK